jgi:hypothetical protein
VPVYTEDAFVAEVDSAQEYPVAKIAAVHVIVQLVSEETVRTTFVGAEHNIYSVGFWFAVPFPAALTP